VTNFADLATQLASILRSHHIKIIDPINMNGSTAEENVYHVMVTSINLKKDAAGSAQDVSIRGTYTSLASAKKASLSTLQNLGYEKDFFTTYDVRSEYSGDWPHGDGVQVYAAVPGSDILTVEIQTTPNKLDFTGDEKGKVAEQLWYVLQTIIHYNLDASGAKRDSVIEGMYEATEQAKQAALTVLLDNDVSKEDFAEYDEFHGQNDWPYGETVVVHAVGQTGENFLVRVVQTDTK